MAKDVVQNGAETATVTAAMLIIGNEILSGRTKDANLHHLASELTELGIRLMEVRVIPDVEAVIVDAVNEVRRHYDYVFTTGGIGPTHDDITAECVAKGHRLQHVTRHLVPLFASQPGARRWRQLLTEGARGPDAQPDLLERALEAMPS